MSPKLNPERDYFSVRRILTLLVEVNTRLKTIEAFASQFSLLQDKTLILTLEQELFLHTLTGDWYRKS